MLKNKTTKNAEILSILKATAVFMPLLKASFGDCPEVLNLVVPANKLGHFRRWIKTGHGILVDSVKELCASECFHNSELIFVVHNALGDDTVLYDKIRTFNSNNASLVVVATTYPLGMKSKDSAFLHVFIENEEWVDDDVYYLMMSDFKSTDAAVFMECCTNNLNHSGIEAYFRTVAQFFSDRNHEMCGILTNGVESLLENAQMTEDSQLTEMFVSLFCNGIKTGNFARTYEFSEICQKDIGENPDFKGTLIFDNTQILIREKDLSDLLKAYLRTAGIEAIKADFVNAGIITSFSPVTGLFVKRFRLRFRDHEVRDYFVVLNGAIYTETGLSMADYIRIIIREVDDEYRTN